MHFQFETVHVLTCCTHSYHFALFYISSKGSLQQENCYTSSQEMLVTKPEQRPWKQQRCQRLTAYWLTWNWYFFQCNQDGPTL